MVRADHRRGCTASLNLHDRPTSAGPSRGSPGLRPDYQRRPVSACLFGWCALEAFRMLLKCTVREVHLHGRPFSSDQLFERGSVGVFLGVILRRTRNRSMKDQRGLPRRHAKFTTGRRESCIAFVSVSHAPHAWTLSTLLQTCASDCTPPVCRRRNRHDRDMDRPVACIPLTAMEDSTWGRGALGRRRGQDRSEPVGRARTASIAKPTPQSHGGGSRGPRDSNARDGTLTPEMECTRRCPTTPGPSRGWHGGTLGTRRESSNRPTR
jgi:hypothetical protein